MPSCDHFNVYTLSAFSSYCVHPKWAKQHFYELYLHCFCYVLDFKLMIISCISILSPSCNLLSAGSSYWFCSLSEWGWQICGTQVWEEAMLSLPPSWCIATSSPLKLHMYSPSAGLLLYCTSPASHDDNLDLLQEASRRTLLRMRLSAVSDHLEADLLWHTWSSRNPYKGRIHESYAVAGYWGFSICTV